MTVASGGTTSTVFLDKTRFEAKYQITSGSSSIFRMTATANTFTDELYSKGIVYGGDYTSNFTNHSLLTKQYVDNLIVGTPSLSQT